MFQKMSVSRDAEEKLLRMRSPPAFPGCSWGEDAALMEVKERDREGCARAAKWEAQDLWEAGDSKSLSLPRQHACWLVSTYRSWKYFTNVYVTWIESKGSVHL